MMALEKKYTLSRNLIIGENDLKTWCDEHGEKGQVIINEWDYEENGEISNYKAGSAQKVSFICNICGEKYIKEIRNRVAGRLHEPCGRRIGVENLKKYHKGHIEKRRTLKVMFPDILEEWDYEENSKNDMDPETLSGYSAKKAKWICKECGNKYEACIRMRTRFNSYCPVCMKKQYKNKIE